MEIKAKHFMYPSNLISILRIFLILPLLLLMKSTSSQSNLWILIVLGFAIFTDFLDGKLSRWLNQVTDLGIILDPIADKLIMAAGLSAMIIYRDFPVTLVIFLIYRDVIILIGGLMITKKNKEPIMANFWGKLNTTVIAMAAFFYFIPSLYLVSVFFIFCGYVTIIISGIAYLRIAEEQLGMTTVQKIVLRTVLFLISVFILMIKNFL